MGFGIFCQILHVPVRYIPESTKLHDIYTLQVILLYIVAYFLACTRGTRPGSGFVLAETLPPVCDQADLFSEGGEVKLHIKAL